MAKFEIYSDEWRAAISQRRELLATHINNRELRESAQYVSSKNSGNGLGRLLAISFIIAAPFVGQLITQVEGFSNQAKPKFNVNIICKGKLPWLRIINHDFGSGSETKRSIIVESESRGSTLVATYPNSSGQEMPYVDEWNLSRYGIGLNNSGEVEVALMRGVVPYNIHIDPRDSKIDYYGRIGFSCNFN